MRPKNSTRFTGTISAAAIGLVVVCVLAAAMLIADRPASSTPLEAQPLKTAAPTAKRIPVAPAPVPKPAASPTRVEAVPIRTVTPNASVAKAVATAPAAPVTITGCLARDNATFRLKDTSGANAPKSRSWKSGFLKKRTATIEVVDAANRLNLPNHVGQRVTLTGMLDDREMQARSLQRVASSCN